MKQNTEVPMEDPADERDAIRTELQGTSMNVLTWHGSEPHVALVDRDAPSEYAIEGETVVLVEWYGEDDYALSVAEGGITGWELTDELVSTHATRTDAIDAAADLFKTDD